MKRLCTLLLVVLLGGCQVAHFEDVSGMPLYAGMIGRTYVTTQAAKLYEVTLDRDYQPTNIIYVIQGPPGFAGPEVLSVTHLPLGTTFTVTRVEKCSSCILDFEPRVEAVVRLSKPMPWPVRVDLKDLRKSAELRKP